MLQHRLSVRVRKVQSLDCWHASIVNVEKMEISCHVPRSLNIRAGRRSYHSHPHPS